MTKNSLFLFLVFFIGTILMSTSTDSYGQKKQIIKQNNEICDTTVFEAEILFIEAEKHYILRNYKQALFFFQKASKADPTNGDIYYKIAETLFQQKNTMVLPTALVNIEKALELEHHNEHYYLLASAIYSKSSNYLKASQVLENMMKKIENMEKHLYLLGTTYHYANKINKAINTYNQAETLLGISEQSSLPKQRIYLEQGKIEEAINELKKLRESFPDVEFYTVQYVNLLLQHQYTEKAIHTLTDFIKKHHNSSSSRLLLIELYQHTHQDKKAHHLLRELFDNHDAISKHQKLLIINKYLQEIDTQDKMLNTQADCVLFILDLLNRFQDLHPDEANVHVARGDLYLILEKMGLAKKEYKMAIQKGSTQFKVWQNILYIESSRHQFDSLIYYSEKGLELFPAQAMFYYFKGYAYLQKNNYNQAAFSLEQAKYLSHSNKELTGEINELLGEIYYQLKEYHKSDDAYDKALQFNPNNTLLLNNYSYYLSLRNVFLDKAENMIIKAVKNEPTNNSYLDTYSWVLFMQGKYKKAQKIMKKIMDTNPSNPIFFDHYGDILFKKGSIEEAVKQWKRAQQQGLNNTLLNDKIINKKLD